MLGLGVHFERALAKHSGGWLRPDIICIDPKTSKRVAVGEAKRPGVNIDRLSLSRRSGGWLQLMTYAECIPVSVGFLTNGLDWRIFSLAGRPLPDSAAKLSLAAESGDDPRAALALACLLGTESLEVDALRGSFSERVLTRHALEKQRARTQASLATDAGLLVSGASVSDVVPHVQRLYTSFRYQDALQVLNFIEQRADDPRVVSLVYSLRGEVCLRRGLLDAAEAHFSDAQRLCRESEDTVGSLNELRHLAVVRRRKKDADGAIRIVRGGLAAHERLNLTAGLSSSLMIAGGSLVDIGLYEEGSALLQSGLSLQDGYSDPITTGNGYLELARTNLKLERYANAKGHLRRAFMDFARLPSLRGMTLALRESKQVRAAALRHRSGS